MPKTRRCPKCHIVGRMHRAHSENAVQKVIRDISPYRRYHCHACDAYSWRWAGFHLSLGDKEYPVWLIVVLILVALFLARYIVSTNGCGMEAPPP
jgi:hypothetical protein